MNLVQFLDDYGRSTATNMLSYRDTAEGGAEPNEFSVPGATLLLATARIRSEGALNFAGDSVDITGAKFRALDFPNTPSTTWDFAV